MKKLITIALISGIIATSMYAGGFDKRFEMMKSRIETKMQKLNGNSDAQKFLTNKLTCIKTAHTELELKECKKKFHPKMLKKLL